MSFLGSALVRAAGAAALIAALASSSGSAPSADRGPVDLALVLAVDASISMDAVERDTQRRGYAAAFRDPVLIQAVTSGFLGRIAVAYVEWGGYGDQTVLVDWTLIDGQGAADTVADRLDDLPKRRAHFTALGDALLFAGRLLDMVPYPASRRVIDVSGDGVNNEGPRADTARDAVTAQGIVVNGLPLLLEDDGRITILDVPDLDLYYEECVIGGPGAFSLPVRRAEDLAAAIRTKMLLEVAGTPPRIEQVSLVSPRVACDIGEQQRRQSP